MQIATVLRLRARDNSMSKAFAIFECEMQPFSRFGASANPKAKAFNVFPKANYFFKKESEHAMPQSQRHAPFFKCEMQQFSQIATGDMTTDK